MTTRSLILSPHEVRAALDGRLGLVVRPVSLHHVHAIDEDGTPMRECRDGIWREAKCPLGVTGDLLIGKETWKAEELPEGLDGTRFQIDDKFMSIENTEAASILWMNAYNNGKHGDKWRSPATMPAWASRITLEVVGVRCMRLRDLSRDDFVSAGMRMADGSPLWEGASDTFVHPMLAFKDFWQSKYGPRYPWDTSWAWAVEVRRVER